MNPDLVRRQIENLKLQFPELAEDEDAWALTIESETGAVEMLRQIERRRQDAAHMAGAIASNIAELGLRQERFEGREKAMRALAFKIMEATNLRKTEMPEATYSIRAGQPKLIIKDESAVPDNLCRIKREPDKTVIKDAMMNGYSPSWAELSNGEPSLSVRVK